MDIERIARAMALADSREMILATSDESQLGHMSDAGWKDYQHMAIAAAETMDQEWQPISTAPNDGQPFIYQDSDEAVSTCSWQSDDCGFSWWDIAGDQIAYPVRWMPLPSVAIIAEERGT